MERSGDGEVMEERIREEEGKVGGEWKPGEMEEIGKGKERGNAREVRG